MLTFYDVLCHITGHHPDHSCRLSSFGILRAWRLTLCYCHPAGRLSKCMPSDRVVLKISVHIPTTSSTQLVAGGQVRIFQIQLPMCVRGIICISRYQNPLLMQSAAPTTPDPKENTILSTGWLNDCPSYISFASCKVTGKFTVAVGSHEDACCLHELALLHWGCMVYAAHVVYLFI